MANERIDNSTARARRKQDSVDPTQNKETRPTVQNSNTTHTTQNNTLVDCGNVASPTNEAELFHHDTEKSK